MKLISDYNKFSLETRIKLQIKIAEIHKSFLFYENHRNKFNKNEDEDRTFKKMAHYAIYVLYRSLFKDIEEKRIDITAFTKVEDIIEAHKSIMNLTDKDICHHDKNSKSFKIENVSNLQNNGSTTSMQSFLSDEQLEIAVEFLVKNILPKIQNTPLKQGNLEEIPSLIGHGGVGKED